MLQLRLAKTINQGAADAGALQHNARAGHVHHGHWRVEMGSPLMRGLAATFDPHPIARAHDNFLVFAAELEVYPLANTSVHICTACPRGSVDACVKVQPHSQTDDVTELAGLRRHWG
jgi:hypothetical protein